VIKPRFSAAGLAIEPVRSDDIPALMEMMGELADFLDGRLNFVTTAEELQTVLFSDPPAMEMILGRQDGEVAGFVNWFEDYKVFSGRRAMRVDYLYVRPKFRTRPLAIAMLVYLLRLAKARGYRYLEGSVLDRNTQARKMYKALKAKELEMRTYHLDLMEVDASVLEVAPRA
jgi:ribosomal protein S18 acetylase RimI-like enzyme